MYYHCSKELFEPYSFLEPRVPKYTMPYEDKETKRVCVCKSINGCLCAIGGFDIGDIINVYEVYNYEHVISPTAEQVQDVMFTGEEWILDTVKIKLAYRIKITDVFIRVHNNISTDLYDYEFI